MRFVIAAVALAIATNAFAQSPREEYRGVVATGLALRKVATTKRVLMIGAHPDDEDNQLLSYLSLGEGADVAYLSLTRGEGGQNSIGGELGPALGVLRTGELLADRTEDLATQLFTRAYDFGFSKNAAEAFQHWPKDSILSDVVAAIRRYRPDVVVAVFTGTPRDGHGQHQVSGILAREAFVAAADPNRFPEQIRAGLRAHAAAKLIQATGYNQMTPSQRFPTGEIDPLLGRSYAQLAAIGRSRHRSQDMGSLQIQGPRFASIRMLEARVNSDSTLFGGTDTTLVLKAKTAKEAPGVIQSLQRYDSLVAAAQARLSAYSTRESTRLMTAAVRELDAAIPMLHDADLKFVALNELASANQALQLGAGIVIDAFASTEHIIPGTTVNLDVNVWNNSAAQILVMDVQPVLPAGWRAERVDSASRTVRAGELVTYKYRVTVPADAAISQPYFLARARAGDIYTWPSGIDYAGQPFDPDPIRVHSVIAIADAQIEQTFAATRRVVDPRQGELRRAVHVTPAFAIRAEPMTSVITLATLSSGSKKGVDIGIEVLSNGAGGNVTVRPQLPSGWLAAPTAATLQLNGAGESAMAHFTITPARGVAAGSYEIPFVATDTNGRTYNMQQRVVDYPHIINRVLYEPAVLHVTVLDAKFARGLRVGYIVGMDAPVPTVLEQLGISVDRLGEVALANADLSKYDAIVIGSRAYEVRPDLIAHNAHVLDYARKGGNIITLYQQYEFINGKYAPYPMTIASPHDRVTDENAPVRLLDSAAIALKQPNRISQQDFVGWVQERSLYMPRTWDPQYQPLLEMNDPGEQAQRGAILTAPLGQGTYTYTGIAFFREIPAGVPGALRLFINLLSMGVKNVAF